MRRKILFTAILYALCLVIQVKASEPEGQINCWLLWGEKSVDDGSLQIYRAGDPVPEGYRLYPEFGGGIVAGEDVPSSTFALWMSEKAGPGEEIGVGINGLVTFKNLKPGLYLIRQCRESEHFLPIAPYIACVPEERIPVDTYPEVFPREGLPKTAQYPEIYLAALGISVAVTGLLLCFQEKRKNG